MNSLLLDIRTPGSISLALKDRARQRRKEQKLSQIALAKKADVSLGSLKRFESTGEISLASLVKLAIALGYEDDFESLFAQPHYQSIDDVINHASRR